MKGLVIFLIAMMLANQVTSRIVLDVSINKATLK
jgi:hypothetical protein